jgi:hypothetical protein
MIRFFNRANIVIPSTPSLAFWRYVKSVEPRTGTKGNGWILESIGLDADKQAFRKPKSAETRQNVSFELDAARCRSGIILSYLHDVYEEPNPYFMWQKSFYLRKSTVYF